MRRLGLALLVVGLVFLSSGIAAAVWASSQADAMSEEDRAADPEKHDFYVTAQSCSLGGAAIGMMMIAAGILVGRRPRDAKAMKTEERMRIAGTIAGISAVVFAVPHLWFWYGVSLAFPGDFQTTPKTDALLIVGGFAVLAAVYATVFTHSSWVKRLPEIFTALPAWVGSVGFTMWGLAYFVLQVQLAFNNDVSSEQYFASETNPNAVWGLYWYSLFIVWGLSLGMAAFYFHRLKKSLDTVADMGLREFPAERNIPLKDVCKEGSS